mgnify:CR=1 FL=1
MNKTTANDIQVQEVVQKYIGTIKAKTVAEKVYEVMREETQHTHNGRECFIHQDETGALVLTMESMVKKSVETILRQYLEDDNVEKCLVQLMPENTATEKIMGIEVIHVKGSNSEIYTKLLKHKASDECEERFMIELQTAIEAAPPDVLHLHPAYSGALAALSAASLRPSPPVSRRKRHLENKSDTGAGCR